MSLEQEIATAKNLVAEWRSSLSSSTFPSDSAVRAQLEHAICEAEEKISKMEQAISLRKQIDGLPEGVVKQHMSNALAQLEAELGFKVPEVSETSAATTGGEAAGALELKVLVQTNGGTHTLLFKDVHPETTLGVFKAMVEERAGVPSASQEVRSSPSAPHPFSGDDSTPLAALGVKNGDTLVVGVKGGADAGGSGGGGGGVAQVPPGQTARSVASRVGRAGVKVKGYKDALALAVHVIMLDAGFVPVAAEEDPNGPRGFAPPVRPLPEGRLVPQYWNADPDAVRFMYRHEKLRGKEVQVKVIWLDDSVVVELTTTPSSTKDPITVALRGTDFVDTTRAPTNGDPTSLFRDLDRLAALIRSQVVAPVLPQAVSNNPTGGRPSSGPTAMVPGGATPEPSRPPPGGHPLPMPVPNPLGPTPVGGFGYGGRLGGLVPDFGGDLQPGGGFGPGGGNLMGPNHPAFTGEGRGGYPPNGGLGMPQPRFDPFGPVVGPTRGGPFPGGEDPTDPRGRNRAFSQPNPDHLPPPGPGNFYF